MSRPPSFPGRQTLRWRPHSPPTRAKPVAPISEHFRQWHLALLIRESLCFCNTILSCEYNIMHHPEIPLCAAIAIISAVWIGDHLVFESNGMSRDNAGDSRNFIRETMPFEECVQEASTSTREEWSPDTFRSNYVGAPFSLLLTSDSVAVKSINDVLISTVPHSFVSRPHLDWRSMRGTVHVRVRMIPGTIEGEWLHLILAPNSTAEDVEKYIVDFLDQVPPSNGEPVVAWMFL